MASLECTLHKHCVQILALIHTVYVILWSLKTRPSAFGMSDPLMDPGDQVGQGDQNGTSITNECFLGPKSCSWDRKPVYWDRKPVSWDQYIVSWDRKPVYWDQKPVSWDPNTVSCDRKSIFWAFKNKRERTRSSEYPDCVHLSRNLHTVCEHLSTFFISMSWLITQVFKMNNCLWCFSCDNIIIVRSQSESLFSFLNHF